MTSILRLKTLLVEKFGDGHGADKSISSIKGGGVTSLIFFFGRKLSRTHVMILDNDDILFSIQVSNTFVYIITECSKK